MLIINIKNYTLLRKMGSQTSPFPTEQPPESKFEWNWRHLPCQNAIYATVQQMCLWLLPESHSPLHATRVENGFPPQRECRYMWHRTTVTCDTIQKLAFRRDRPHFDRFAANAATCQDYPCTWRVHVALKTLRLTIINWLEPLRYHVWCDPLFLGSPLRRRFCENVCLLRSARIWR